MDKIVKDFNTLILRKRSIAFCVISALIAVYACSSAYDEEFFVEDAKALKAGEMVYGTRVVDGKTVHTAVGGTVADYVDLGIMVNGKRVLFATHNLGAYSEKDTGARIAWGELGTKEEGYVRGVKCKNGEEYYGYDNLKYCEGGDSEVTGSFTKYYDKDESNLASYSLAPSDDAATVNWGSDWRTPTKAEMIELLMSKNLEHKFTKDGLLITSKVLGCQGNSIFLPYMEDATPGVYEKNDGYAYYMTSEINENGDAECGVIASKGVHHGWVCGSHHEHKYLGNVIRPVRVVD